MDLSPVLVIGLGRFGSAVSQELMKNGVEVMGVDIDERRVHEHAATLTEAIVADSTDIEALFQLGIEDTERVVLSIGSHLEASILTASNVVELGVRDIWAKADSDPHARILTQIGVHHVVRPERDTGKRVAHLLRGRIQDFAELDENFGVIKLTPSTALIATNIDSDWLWKKYRVQIISVYSTAGQWLPYAAGQPLNEAIPIIVAGKPEALECFSRDM